MFLSSITWAGLGYGFTKVCDGDWMKKLMRIWDVASLWAPRQRNKLTMTKKNYTFPPSTLYTLIFPAFGNLNYGDRSKLATHL
jgi:hypothetical protein